METKRVCTYGNKLGKALVSIFFVSHLFSLSAQDYPDKVLVDSLSEKAECFIGVSVDSVLVYANRAIFIAGENRDWESVSDNYYIIQKAFYQNSEMDSARKYIWKSRSFLNGLDDEKKKVRLIHSLGLINYKTGELDSALFYYQKEFEMEKGLGNEERQASALGNIGMVFYRQSKYQKAVDNYFHCLKIFQKIGDDQKVMLTYNNIGNVYRYWEDYPKALAYYRKAMEMTGAESNKRFEGFMNNNLAIIFRKQLQFDSAIVYYKEAKGIYEEVNYQKGIASALTGLAITYNKLGELGQSRKTYLEAIAIQKKVNDRIGLASNYGNLGILLLDEEKPLKAITYLEKSDSLAREIGYREVQKNNFESFRDAYQMLGNFEKALDYELKFVALKDSIYNIEKLKEIENIQEKYQAEQKQHSIDVLNEQARVKDVKLSRKNIFIGALVVIVLLTLVITWLINRNYKAHANRRRIILENKLLRSQMNPHFMFNSLNAIQTYILRKNPLEGASYLSKFADLMRSILYNSREEFILLEKEIAMIDNYLELQQIRFKGLFTYSLQVDHAINVKGVMIPPMLAQPFIENAIEHGFKNIDYTGRLEISFAIHDDSILIKVTDNGIGVVASMEENKERKKPHKSLATVISKERLDLFNKRMKKSLFSLMINQLKDEKEKIKGTEVKLTIPFKR
ncbi:MAG: tetratricopeptide repeat protein [Chlorobi bacterium]|nr:tetratricopeptide repeat protein [Chlorobiota bacterium]